MQFPSQVWEYQSVPDVEYTTRDDAGRVVERFRFKGMSTRPAGGIDGLIATLLDQPARGRWVAKYLAAHPDECKHLADAHHREKQWTEEQHPRDDHGRWVEKGHILAAAHDKGKADALRAKVTDPAQRAKLNAALKHAKHSPHDFGGAKPGTFAAAGAGDRAAKVRPSIHETAEHIHRLRAEVGDGAVTDAHVLQLAQLVGRHSVAEIRQLKAVLGVQTSRDAAKEQAVSEVAGRALRWAKERMAHVKAQRAKRELTAKLKADGHTGTDEHGRVWKDGKVQKPGKPAKATGGNLAGKLPSQEQWAKTLRKVWSDTAHETGHTDADFEEHRLAGRCIPACDVLQKHLAEQGVKTTAYRGGHEGEDHVWLQTADGTIIDPTEGQFRRDIPVGHISVYKPGSGGAKAYAGKPDQFWNNHKPTAGKSGNAAGDDWGDSPTEPPMDRAEYERRMATVDPLHSGLVDLPEKYREPFDATDDHAMSARMDAGAKRQRMLDWEGDRPESLAAEQARQRADARVRRAGGGGDVFGDDDLPPAKVTGKLGDNAPKPAVQTGQRPNSAVHPLPKYPGRENDAEDPAEPEAESTPAPDRRSKLEREMDEDDPTAQALARTRNQPEAPEPAPTVATRQPVTDTEQHARNAEQYGTQADAAEKRGEAGKAKELRAKAEESGRKAKGDKPQSDLAGRARAALSKGRQDGFADGHGLYTAALRGEHGKEAQAHADDALKNNLRDPYRHERFLKAVAGEPVDGDGPETQGGSAVDQRPNSAVPPEHADVPTVAPSGKPTAGKMSFETDDRAEGQPFKGSLFEDDEPVHKHDAHKVVNGVLDSAGRRFDGLKTGGRKTFDDAAGDLGKLDEHLAKLGHWDDEEADLPGFAQMAANHKKAIADIDAGHYDTHDHEVMTPEARATEAAQEVAGGQSVDYGTATAEQRLATKYHNRVREALEKDAERRVMERHAEGGPASKSSHDKEDSGFDPSAFAGEIKGAMGGDDKDAITDVRERFGRLSDRQKQRIADAHGDVFSPVDLNDRMGQMIERHEQADAARKSGGFYSHPVTGKLTLHPDGLLAGEENIAKLKASTDQLEQSAERGNYKESARKKMRNDAKANRKAIAAAEKMLAERRAEVESHGLTPVKGMTNWDGTAEPTGDIGHTVYRDADGNHHASVDAYQQHQAKTQKAAADKAQADRMARGAEEPHTITRDEYLKHPEVWGRMHERYFGNHTRGTGGEMYNTQREYGDWAKDHAGQEHESAVQSALDRGEEVHPDVLKDYPGMTARKPKEKTAADHVTDRHVQDHFNDYYADDLKSERFLSLPKEKQQELIQNAGQKSREILEKTAQRIMDKDLSLRDSGTLHPDNKHSRRLFESMTGIALPKTVKGTNQVVEQYLGTEKVAAADKSKADAATAERDAAAKAEKDKTHGPHHSDRSFMANGGMARGKAYTHLDVPMRSNGVVKNAHEHVEDWVKAGGTPRMATWNKEGRKIGGERKGSTVTEPTISMPDGTYYSVSKTAHDYAQHLINGGQSRTHDKNGPPTDGKLAEHETTAEFGRPTGGGRELALPKPSSGGLASPKQATGGGTEPNSVMMILRDNDGQEIGRIAAPHDGTKEGMRKAAESLTERAEREHGGEWSNMNSTTGASDHTGTPKFVISPNRNNVNPIESDAGKYSLGLLDYGPKKPAGAVGGSGSDKGLPAPSGETIPAGMWAGSGGEKTTETVGQGRRSATEERPNSAVEPPASDPAVDPDTGATVGTAGRTNERGEFHAGGEHDAWSRTPETAAGHARKVKDTLATHSGWLKPSGDVAPYDPVSLVKSVENHKMPLGATVKGGLLTDAKLLARIPEKHQAKLEAHPVVQRDAGHANAEKLTKWASDHLDKSHEASEGKPAATVHAERAMPDHVEYLMRDGDGGEARIEGNYHETMQKLHPGATAHIHDMTDGSKGVAYRKGGKTVGLVMGKKGEDSDGVPADQSLLEEGPTHLGEHFDPAHDEGAVEFGKEGTTGGKKEFSVNSPGSGLGEKGATVQVREMKAKAGEYHLIDEKAPKDRRILASNLSKKKAKELAKQVVAHAHGTDEHGLVFKPRGSQATVPAGGGGDSGGGAGGRNPDDEADELTGVGGTAGDREERPNSAKVGEADIRTKLRKGEFLKPSQTAAGTKLGRDGHPGHDAVVTDDDGGMWRVREARHGWVKVNPLGETPTAGNEVLFNTTSHDQDADGVRNRNGNLYHTGHVITYDQPNPADSEPQHRFTIPPPGGADSESLPTPRGFGGRVYRSDHPAVNYVDHTPASSTNFGQDHLTHRLHDGGQVEQHGRDTFVSVGADGKKIDQHDNFEDAVAAARPNSAVGEEQSPPDVSHSEVVQEADGENPAITNYHLKKGDGWHVQDDIGTGQFHLRRLGTPGDYSTMEEHGSHPSLQSAIDAAYGRAAAAPAASGGGDTSADPDVPYSLAEHDRTTDRLNRGEITPDELRQAHARLQQHKDAVAGEMKKYTVPQLRQLAGTWHAKGMNKGQLLAHIHEQMGEQLVPYGVTGGTRVHSFGEKWNPVAKQTKELATATDDHVKQHADWYKKNQAEREQAKAERQAGMENPQTLDDYRRLIQTKGGYGNLSPEHQARHDELHAEARRGRSMAERQEKAKIAGFSGGEAATGGIDIVTGHHQKRDMPTHTVTVTDRLGSEKFQEALQAAKRLGGSYVNANIAKQYNATPGFQFFDRAKAEQFAQVLRGESVDRSGEVAGEMAARQQNRAESLADKAEGLIGAGEDSLGRERRANTRRQAAMAASAEAAAREKIATGKTLQRVGDGQADGTLKHLAGVRSAQDLHTLDRALNLSRWDRVRAAEKAKEGGMTMREREAMEAEPHGHEDVAAVQYPYPSVHQYELQDIAKTLADEPGLKRFAEKMRAEGDVNKDIKFQGSAGGMKTRGGQFLHEGHFADHQDRKYIAHHMQDEKGEPGQVRVHASHDYRLVDSAKRQGSDHRGPFHTADGGKSWAVSPEAAVVGAINKGHRLDVVPHQQAKSVKFTSPDDIEAIRTAARKLARHPDDRLRRVGQSLKEKLEHYDRLKRADIHTTPELRAALREYLPLKSRADKEDPVKAAERELKGRDIPGFFPTPRPVIEDMLDRADIQPGHSVLEPSAGKGDILDAVRERHPDATTHAVEPVSALRDILEKKGHTLAGHDIMEHQGQYDRAVMNPPFENGQDASHVRKVFDNHLKPGGRLVAIMSEGPFQRSGKKDQEFRDWLDSVGGEHEAMPEGSFAGNDAFRKTGVRTRMVTIDKPEGAAPPSPATDATGADTTPPSDDQQPNSAVPKEDWHKTADEWMGEIGAVKQARETLASPNIDEHPGIKAKAEKAIADHKDAHRQLVEGMHEHGEVIPQHVWGSHGLKPTAEGREADKKAAEATARQQSVRNTSYDDLLDNLRYHEQTGDHLSPEGEQAHREEIGRRQAAGDIPGDHPDFDKFNNAPTDLLNKQYHEMTRADHDRFQRYYARKAGVPHDEQAEGDRHRAVVEKAIQGGHEVPPEVQKDYPDLFPERPNSAIPPSDDDHGMGMAGGDWMAHSLRAVIGGRKVSDLPQNLQDQHAEVQRLKAERNALSEHSGDEENKAKYAEANAKFRNADFNFRRAVERHDASQRPNSAIPSDAPAESPAEELTEVPADPSDAAESSGISDTVSDTPAKPKATRKPRSGTPTVQDFGEVLPGARKHAAVPTGPKKPKEEKKEGAALPAWRRPYGVHQDATTGKYFVTHGNQAKKGPGGPKMLSKPGEWKPADFDTAEQAEQFATTHALASRHGVSNRGTTENPNYAIYRKVTDRKMPTVKDGFATYNDAMKHMAANPHEILNHKFPDWEDYSYLDRVQRTGPDHGKAGGKHATPEDFKKFGFRGVQFGNWQTNRDGQTSLTHAYHSLHDLADVTGLTPKQLSLGGRLGLAFGARGTGGKHAAKAHYEPDHEVMNITKMQGAGTLGHEWWHALEHALSKEEHGEKSEHLLTNRSPYQPKNKEVADAFKNLVSAMKDKDVTREVHADGAKRDAERAHKNLSDELKAVHDKYEQAERYHNHDLKAGRKSKFKPFTPEQRERWEGLKAKILAGDLGEVKYHGHIPVHERVGEMDEMYKAATGRSLTAGQHESTANRLHWAIKRKQDADQKVKAAGEGASETRRELTDYRKAAHDLDKTMPGDYFSLHHEMAARSFQAYLADKLKEKERQSDYLVGRPDNGGMYAMLGLKPFPEGEERQKINTAFDDLFDAIRKHYAKK